MSILFCFKGSIIERFQAIRTYLVERQNLDSAKPKKIDPITISPSLLKLDNAEDYSELDLHTILGKSYKSHVILNFCHMVMFRKKIGEKCIYFFKDFVTSKRWPMFLSTDQARALLHSRIGEVAAVAEQQRGAQAGGNRGDVFGKDGVVSLINKGARDLTARAQGDTEEANKQDFASTLLKFTQSNTPFINQFMVKHAINYMFMYELQESLNPGTLERMEKRMQEDTGQTFMVPPSETVQ